ncbi:MAG: hypothetical protein HKN32_01050 [Flavobacteriales bacterium]|nr:hypothetical protein [Flavobacteriales bacterium]
MDILPVLDFAISLALIYTFCSMLTSWITEFIAQRRNFKGRFLKTCLTRLLRDERNLNLAEDVFKHPLIYRTKESEKRLPDRIEPKLFARVLVDVVGQVGKDTGLSHDPETGETSFRGDEVVANSDARFVSGVTAMKEGNLKRILSNLATSASAKKVSVESEIQEWYQDHRSEMSKWYKKEIRVPLFVVGLCFALFANVDSVHLADELWHNAELRNRVAKAGIDFVEENGEKLPDEAYQETMRRLSGLGLPIGWQDFWQYEIHKVHFPRGTDSTEVDVTIEYPTGKITPMIADSLSIALTAPDSVLTIVKSFNIDPGIPPLPEEPGFWSKVKDVWSWFWGNLGDGLLKFIGFLLTAFAVSFGAPFWYDMLRRLTDYRKTAAKEPATSNSTGT